MTKPNKLEKKIEKIPLKKNENGYIVWKVDNKLNKFHPDAEIYSVSILILAEKINKIIDKLNEK